MEHGNLSDSLEVSLACDNSGFLRCECPHCMLEFKEAIDPSSMQDILSLTVTRYLSENGVKSSETDSHIPFPSPRWCPYCEHESEQQNFIHSETHSYISQIARREILEPLVAKLFDGFDSHQHRNNKFFSIQITSSFTRSQRPISGPESDDQIIINCLDCKKRFKVIEQWSGIIRCHFCGIELSLQ